MKKLRWQLLIIILTGLIVGVLLLEEQPQPVSPLASPEPVKGGVYTEALVGSNVSAKKPPPDLIIAGNSNLILPFVDNKGKLEFHSPFYIEGVTKSVEVIYSEGLAFALGVCIMLYAFDTIQLGKMPWVDIIRDGLKNGS